MTAAEPSAPATPRLPSGATGAQLGANAGLWLTRAAFRLLGRMERESALRLARRLVPVYGALGNRDRLRRMVAFFGPLGWSAARCARLNAAHLDYLARWTVEVGRLFHQPPEEIVGRIQLVGEEHLKAALARGRGVMLLITHMGTNLHIGCALGARGYRLVGVFNARSIAGRRYFSRLAARHRVEFAFVGRNGGFAARRTLRNSGIFALAMDGDARENRATPVRFGHVRMPVDLGPAALALRTRCAVVLGTSRQIGDGRSLVTFLPDPAIKSLAQTSPDPGVLCEQWLQVFYDDLLACPEQWWLWSFSKFSPPDPPHSTTCSEATQR